MPIIVGFMAILFILADPYLLLLIPFAMLIVNPLAFIALLATLVAQMFVLAYGFPAILSVLILIVSLWLLLGGEKRQNYFLGKKEDSSMLIFVTYMMTYLLMLLHNASL